jgi:hypothetical protein
VEVVTDMYRRGVTLEDVKLMLSLASLQNGGQMLTALDEVRGGEVPGGCSCCLVHPVAASLSSCSCPAGLCQIKSCSDL